MAATAKRFDCFYGPSGEGKSSAALRVAQQMFKEQGKKTRVYVGDGSGSTYLDSGLVDAGVVELYDFSARPNPLAVSQKMCDRYWPNEAGVLVPPKPEELAQVGLIIYEGLSVMANYIMGGTEGGLANRSGKGEKIGQDSPIQIKDGDVTVGGNPMSHFGVAQRHMTTNIERSKGFDGWVIWTAHEKAAEDKTSGEKLVGPEVVGGAMTPHVPRMFQNTLHFTTVGAKKKAVDTHSGKNVDSIVTEYRVYTRDHYDPDGISFVKYKAVSRCPRPDLMPDYFVSKSMGDNVLQFYSALKEAREAVLKEMGLAK